MDTPAQSLPDATPRRSRVHTTCGTRARTLARSARIAALAIVTASTTAGAMTLGDPAHFAVAATYTPSVPTPYGGMHFSANGATLYLVGGADTTSSALYAMSVTRDASTSRVIALGAPAKVFDGAPASPDPAGLDSGLEFGPGGTLFYSYYPSPNLAQRPGGVAGTEQEDALPGVASLSGLTFSPHRIDPGTGFGRLQVSTGTTQTLYEVPLVPGGPPNSFVVPSGGSLTLFAKLYRSGPPRVGGQAVTAIQYVPGGTYGGDLLYTSFVDREIWRVAIDEATGLPVGGANTPVEERFASGFSSIPFGLAFDPVRPDSLFASTWDDVATNGNVISEITGFAATFATTTTTSTSTSTSSSSTTTSTSSSSSTSTSTSTTQASTSSTSSTTILPATSSSTTLPVPSTSTSTSTTHASTTTSSTTLVPTCDAGDPDACDDGDPCTVDTCTGGSCTWDPLIDLDGITCTCEQPPPATCVATDVPRRAQALLAKACQTFGAAADTNSKRFRRCLLRGARLLQRAEAQVTRTQTAGRLSSECIGDLATRWRVTRDRARQLAASRH